MKRIKLLALFSLAGLASMAGPAVVYGPDSLLRVSVDVEEGRPLYSVSYGGKVFVEPSPLGFVADVGDFATGMACKDVKTRSISESYTLDRCKTSAVDYRANELKVTLVNRDGKPVDVTFRVSRNDVAFRYELPRYGETGSVVIRSEATGLRAPPRSSRRRATP